jgi:hypothetical protein
MKLRGYLMGDRFYEQQGKHKPKRILKKDIIAEINEILRVEMLGLDKCTVATLTQLTEAIENVLVKK